MCSNEELYTALLALTKECASTLPAIQGGRKLYYISAEFLLGKLLSNNLINLGLYDEVNETLKAAGKSLAAVEGAELEPSLGNGGLGRLAPCFLDSIATLGLPGDGVGLCYHFGLFRQFFWERKQLEEANPWIQKERWLERAPFQFEVCFKHFALSATMYDIDVIAPTIITGTLRYTPLFSASFIACATDNMSAPLLLSGVLPPRSFSPGRSIPLLPVVS